ncbi:MAG: DUF4132 domain-containing protein [Myxococcota bacterium]|nr:DUF4132 domain-containing protein [Myxococcota bacterium]
MAVENERTRIYLEKVEEPAFAHGIQAPPKGVKLKKSDWCQTNPSQKAFCLLNRKGVYEVAIGDAAGLHTFTPPLMGKSFPYCFSADGQRLLLVHERDLLEIDLLSYQLSKLHSTRRKGSLVAGYVGDDVYLFVDRSLSYYRKRGASLEELWRQEAAMEVATVFDTGGQVLGLVPKPANKKKASMVFVRLDEKGFFQLGRLAGLELVATWFHRPQGGRLRTFARDGWYDRLCSWYELHNVEDDIPPERDTVLMDPKQLETLPKVELRRHRQPSQPQSPAQKAIRKLDELSYTKLINLYSRHFGPLDLGADSPVVEQFSWAAEPWKGMVQAFDSDRALVLLAKYMTYMYFNYPHSLLRLWHRATREHPHDELVARLCMKVLLEGHFQPDACIALMEPALGRGDWDWCALARDTQAKPTADAAQRLVAWAAPRGVAGLAAYLEPHLPSFPEWALQRIKPALEKMARPGEAAHEASPSSTLAQREHLEATLRSAQSATTRIRALRDLAAIAEQAGLMGDLLEETRLDWLGFDPDGKRAFQYGEHALVLHLGEDLGLGFQLGTGALSKRPPKGEKDPTADAELGALRKAIRAQLGATEARLERALMTSRCWPAWRFQVSFLDHPIMWRIARSLVFERVHREDCASTFFVLNSDGSLVDEQGSVVTLIQEDKLRLAHPLRMSLAQRERFSRILADRPMAPLVAQLGRVTYGAERDPLERVFEGVAPLNALALLRRFREHGFVRGELDEEHGEVFANHELPLEGGLSLVVWHSLLPRSSKSLGRDERATLLRAEFVRKNEPVEPVQVDPVVYSELLTRLRQIVGS